MFHHQLPWRLRSALCTDTLVATLPKPPATAHCCQRLASEARLSVSEPTPAWRFHILARSSNASRRRMKSARFVSKGGIHRARSAPRGQATCLGREECPTRGWRLRWTKNLTHAISTYLFILHCYATSVLCTRQQLLPPSLLLFLLLLLRRLLLRRIAMKTSADNNTN